MKIAIMHYHLNHGGVAQVVQNHLQAIHALPDQLLPDVIVLLHGGCREGFPSDLPARLRKIQVREVIIPELGYDEDLPVKPEPLVLAKRIETMLGEIGCVAEDTALHVHNHALGKNVSLPGAVAELAERRFGVLLQMHDFVEDFRPASFRRLQKALAPNESTCLSEVLYPQAPHIHYAVLNRRDWSVLRDAGVDASRLHFLPNAVPPTEALPDRARARRKVTEQLGLGRTHRYVLYPVRGIRRKNLGETLLWAAAASTETAFGFTLPPLNPIEQPSYTRWRALASELRLPCYFETGGESGLHLADNLSACDRVLTTSLAEGFGMVFLEACLSHRPLIGRDLPEITSDFAGEGMTFAGLEPRLDVPVAWVGRHKLLDMLMRTYNATLESYGREPVSRVTLEEGLESKLRDGCIDFGDLDADLQERVIRKVGGDAEALESLVQINPMLRDAIYLHDAVCLAEAEKNAAVVMARYSLGATGRRLFDIYQDLMTSRRGPVSGLSAGERILDAFLNLRRFRPVRQ